MPVTSEHWRKRAEELRILAADATDAKEKQTLLKLAADYEHLAQRAAQRAQTGS